MHIRSPRSHPALAGARVAGLQEHRELTARVRSVLLLIGKDDPSLAKALATVSYVLLAGATILGLTAGPLRGAVSDQGVAAWGVPLALVLAAVLALLVTRRHDAGVRARHAALLTITGDGVGAGLRTGLSMSLIPVVVITVSQCLRHGTLPTVAAGAAVLGSATTVLLPRRPGAGASRRLVLSTCALLAVSATLVQLHRSAPWFASLIESIGLPALTTSAGAAVALGAGVSTALSARWIGAHRWGPRAASAHRSAGATVAVALTTGWVVALLVQDSARLGVLAEHAVLLGPVLATLLLRARHVRLVSPEGLGHGLLFARDAGADARHLVGHYRVNSFVLLAPAFAGASVLLALVGSVSVIPLLWAFLVLEVAVDSMVVQRTTALVPVHQLSMLVTHSRSGLSAALCLGVVFTAAGAAGLFPVFVFSDYPSESTLAAGLLGLAAVVVLTLTSLDARPWLRDLRAFHR